MEIASKKDLKVEVIRRETIKPSSPSPDDKGSFRLSLLHQLAGPIYVPALIFYKGGGSSEKADESTQRLKSSLSKALTRFYPFSGRCKDHLSISCNDEGVEYMEAQVDNNYSLSDILEKPNPEELTLFVPDESHYLSPLPLFLVQVSFFKCGGMALGMKFCHKIADAATFTSFICGWANASLGDINGLIIPDFTASTVFPPTVSLPVGEVVSVQNWPGIRTSRFVFGPSELATLQAKATEGGPRPTRFEAISAFLWKTAILSRKESTKPSVFVWAVNIRSRLQPPLPEHCFGNVAVQAVAHQDKISSDDDGRYPLDILADKLRRGPKETCNDYLQGLPGDEGIAGIWKMVKNREETWDKARDGAIEVHTLSSWCKFPLYEADFGWGKPLWVTTGGLFQNPNMIMLMDTRDGRGIEAWVSLPDRDMTVFESNRELQNYASCNPSAFY